MSKPIEPGCLAIVINSAHSDGATVKVLSSSNGFMGTDWIVERCDGVPFTGLSFGGTWVAKQEAYAKNSQLIRIDGDEHVSTEQREEVEA